MLETRDIITPLKGDEDAWLGLDCAEAIWCDKEAQMRRVMLHKRLVIEALIGDLSFSEYALG